MSTVTIVTRTQNRPRLLARALSSVLGQTYQNWEHIIVNDGGDRSTVEGVVAKKRAAYRGRLRILHLNPSTGMQRAANRGIAEGSGTYLCLHDDDDTWAPEHLERAVTFLEKEGPKSAYQGVIGRTELIEEKVENDGTIIECSRRSYIPLDEINLFRVGFENPFPPIAFCFRRSAFEELGPFNPRFNVAGDYDFNFRFVRRFEVGVLPEISAFYHIRRSPSDPAEGNSVESAAREHKLRYNELKNYYLREAENQQDASLALAFNLSRYLVEIEWVVHETRQRTTELQAAQGGVSEAQAAALAEQNTRLEALRDTILENFHHDSANLREAFTHRLDQLLQAGETHAANLWADLNQRNRETLDAVETVGRRLTGEQAPKIDQLLAQLSALTEDVNRASENIWKDLNARARENVAAVEALNERQTALLESVREAIEHAAKQQSAALDKGLGTMHDTLAGEAQKQLEATEERAKEQSAALVRLAEKLSAIEERNAVVAAQAAQERQEAAATLTRKIADLEREAAEDRQRKNLLSLGPLQLSWKRRPASGPDESTTQNPAD